MKTIGERIRQAREARGMSGETLAQLAGYKHQSAIGNLENRASGTGGNKISVIAEVLQVPVEWLLNGPDSDVVPFKVNMANHDANEHLVNALQDWRLQASSKSQEVIDSLILLAKKNKLRDEDWQAIDTMVLRFMDR